MDDPGQRVITLPRQKSSAGTVALRFTTLAKERCPPPILTMKAFFWNGRERNLPAVEPIETREKYGKNTRGR